MTPTLVPQIPRPQLDAMRARANNVLDGHTKPTMMVAQDQRTLVDHLIATYQRLMDLQLRLVAIAQPDVETTAELRTLISEYGLERK